MKYAIIGGTGIYTMGDSKALKVKNEYGEVELDILNIDGIEIAFLSRHGKEHSVPPHLINYRANIKALHDLGVEFIFSIAAVGSCNENFAPGDLVVINDFLDFTKMRESTFYTGFDKKVLHVEMSDPYCKNLRSKLFEKSSELNIQLKGEGVYVSTEGPRFETAAEIKMFKNLGGDVVGMTNVPEVNLAKELGMCYSCVSIVVNWCTGMTEEISSHDIHKALEGKKEKLSTLFLNIFKENINNLNCNCKNCLL